MPSQSERGTHYDLMLEHGGKLLTWAIPEPPRAGLRTCATKLPDHRLAYLEYEGPVSDNRGDVRRADAGEYLVSQWDDTAMKLELRSPNGDLHVELRHQAETEWIAEFSAG
jgi:hypothetical protein